MDVYQPALLTRKLSIPMTSMGGDIDTVILQALRDLEGQCIEEGYLKRKSCSVIRYSCGMLKDSNVIVQVVFECKIAFPVAGQKLVCVVENNTKAGIKARLDAYENPFILFLARDHHHMNPTFGDIKENDKMNVIVVGQRFDINDKKICIIAMLESMYVAPENEMIETPTRLADTKKIESEPDKLVFNFKSANKKPGKGVNESVHSDYTELSKIVDWRKQLSNGDVAPFTWTGKDVLHEPFPEGTTWNSIEHALQGAKFKTLGKPDLAAKFILGNEYGTGDGTVALSHQKEGKLKDVSAWNDLSTSVLSDVAKSKFTQHEDRARMLKLTHDAELWQLETRGKQMVRCTYLEEIRSLLR